MTRERVNRAADMEVFATAIERGSFSAAARVLGLSPSAVSRTVAGIEARLGVRLVIRTTRQLAVTPEGEAYHRAARRILEDLAEAEHAICNQGSPRGRLRVSSTLSHGRHVLIPLLPEFLERYPAIKVDLSLTDARIDLVEERADVAIRIGPLPDSNLMARRLGDSGRTVIASPAYLARHGTPREPEDLRNHNIINFNFRRHNPDWSFRRDGEDFELDVAGNIEANNGETVVQLVEEGIGIARVGTFHVARMIEEGRLVPLLDDYNPGDREPIHALFIGGTTMPARVRVFVDYLVEKLR
ncbi:LysR family transcriptional regulator [Sphingosinicella sp. LHD-64]|uniref:LysR family transcriptional regulator n=1 Tax=Sphingosinicella sp. LHD-64 TaxID=3072139 RepID=UPI002810008A|nr:LysR family transcriptional regulator [Sphingosinicella sp. LHD-64]MDQ8755800.1 LysR family transcriptional regulator [Sphingosinicella sp. LHD-64]